MKNRTVIGIICIVLAVAVMFLVAPIVNNLTSDTVKVIRLSENVVQGTAISEKNLETVEVKSNTVTDGVLTKASDIVGKYAVSNLYKGDYLTTAKLSGEANTADSAFASLDGSKVAVSVTIDSFAAGLSGKLQNGDIISLIVVNKDSKEAVIPAEFKYLRVITTTTAGGVDKDSVVKNEDGTFELPTTVTVLVNTKQAKLLALYESETTMQVALVYRGDKETANKFLAKQDEYFGGNANE